MPRDRHDRQVTAWQKLHQELGKQHRRSTPRSTAGRHNVKWLLLAAIGLAVIVTPLAVATDGRPIIQGERNAGTQETAIVTNAGNNAQSTRQSNQAPGGRAAGYGCENDGTAEINACANYVNRGQGPAAAFRTRGQVPFVIRDTNRGRVEHLNADLLDDRDAGDFVQKTEQLFAQVRAGADSATVEDQRGATGASRVDTGRYRVDFGDTNLSACAFQVTSADVGQSRFGSADVWPADNTLADVQLRDEDGNAADGHFNLTVTC